MDEWINNLTAKFEGKPLEFTPNRSYNTFEEIFASLQASETMHYSLFPRSGKGIYKAIRDS